MRELLERAANGANLPFRDLHIILDALPTPLSWATLPGGQIRFVNRFFTNTFGYADGEFSTVDDWIDRAYLLEEDRRQARVRWKELWEVESTGIAEVEPFEVQVLCADGSIRTVQHRGILLHEVGVGIATFEDISDRKLAEDVLRRIAFEDPLTGLPNRRVLQERWSKSMPISGGPEGMAALLLIDLDGFKGINDRFGHDGGDEVLTEVARRLCDSVGISGLVCRLGGDEFVVLLPHLRTLEQVEQLCWRIETALARPFALAARPITLGASIGASLYPQDGRDLHDLLKRADEALYRLKTLRKGGWGWFKVPASA